MYVDVFKTSNVTGVPVDLSLAKFYLGLNIVKFGTYAYTIPTRALNLDRSLIRLSRDELFGLLLQPPSASRSIVSPSTARRGLYIVHLQLDEIIVVLGFFLHLPPQGLLFHQCIVVVIMLRPLIITAMFLILSPASFVLKMWLLLPMLVLDVVICVERLAFRRGYCLIIEIVLFLILEIQHFSDPDRFHVDHAVRFKVDEKIDPLLFVPTEVTLELFATGAFPLIHVCVDWGHRTFQDKRCPQLFTGHKKDGRSEVLAPSLDPLVDALL
mmetsp:Transcript_30546/g.69741  ORF Transcript_30546/g.69741 Transcript_30546/m.69741 type:complete len:269 (-) Transcript_30546:229-1035(-)